MCLTILHWRFGGVVPGVSTCGCHVHLPVSHLVHLHVGHLVHLHVGHHNVILTLCEGSETLIEWKSESITDQLTDDGLVGVDLEILDTF